MGVAWRLRPFVLSLSKHEWPQPMHGGERSFALRANPIYQAGLRGSAIKGRRNMCPIDFPDMVQPLCTIRFNQPTVFAGKSLAVSVSGAGMRQHNKCFVIY